MRLLSATLVAGLLVPTGPSMPGQLSGGEYLLLDTAGDGLCSGPGVNVQVTRRVREHTDGWICKDADDVWLFIDQNQNGRVDSLEEVLGGGLGPPNGLDFLAVFDGRPPPGHAPGHPDGIISSKDSIFERLLVWHDRDADGVSAEAEISGAGYFGILGISLGHAIPPKFTGGQHLHATRVTAVETKAGLRAAYTVRLVRHAVVR